MKEAGLPSSIDRDAWVMLPQWATPVAPMDYEIIVNYKAEDQTKAEFVSVSPSDPYTSSMLLPNLASVIMWIPTFD